MHNVPESYVPWRERYAPPIIRMRGSFVAAADQAARYGRQCAELNAMEHERSFGAVFDAWLAFLSQFNSSLREVLSRTFWQAYNA